MLYRPDLANHFLVWIRPYTSERRGLGKISRQRRRSQLSKTIRWLITTTAIQTYGTGSRRRRRGTHTTGLKVRHGNIEGKVNTRRRRFDAEGEIFEDSHIATKRIVQTASTREIVHGRDTSCTTIALDNVIVQGQMGSTRFQSTSPNDTIFPAVNLIRRHGHIIHNGNGGAARGRSSIGRIRDGQRDGRIANVIGARWRELHPVEMGRSRSHGAHQICGAFYRTFTHGRDGHIFADSRWGGIYALRREHHGSQPET